MFINVFINYFSSSLSVLSFVTFNLVFKIVNYQILKDIFVGFIIFEKYTLLKSVALVTAHHSHSLLTK